MKILIFLLLTASCSSFQAQKDKRNLQTEVIRTINANEANYAQCAKTHDIFNHLGENRIRLDVDVKINKDGQIEEFKTDTTRYPNEFLNCIYNILDNSDFPKLEKGEVIHFKQPFIFKAP